MHRLRALGISVENSIKAHEIIKTQVLKNGIFNHTKQTVDTDKTPFCGAMFSLHRAVEWDGTPDFPGKGRKAILSWLDIE